MQQYMKVNEVLPTYSLEDLHEAVSDVANQTRHSKKLLGLRGIEVIKRISRDKLIWNLQRKGVNLLIRSMIMEVLRRKP